MSKHFYFLAVLILISSFNLFAESKILSLKNKASNECVLIELSKDMKKYLVCGHAVSQEEIDVIVTNYYEKISEKIMKLRNNVTSDIFEFFGIELPNSLNKNPDKDYPNEYLKIKIVTGGCYEGKELISKKFVEVCYKTFI